MSSTHPAQAALAPTTRLRSRFPRYAKGLIRGGREVSFSSSRSIRFIITCRDIPPSILAVSILCTSAALTRPISASQPAPLKPARPAYFGCETTCSSQPTQRRTPAPPHSQRSSMLLLPMIRSLSQTILPLLAASTLVTAQDDSSANISPTSFAPPDPSPYVTATIFLPGSLHELPGGQHLAASIITAVCSILSLLSCITAILIYISLFPITNQPFQDVNQTAFAIGCMYAPVNASTSGPHGCSLQSSITVTGGESTLIYTYNPIVTTDNGM